MKKVKINYVKLHYIIFNCHLNINSWNFFFVLILIFNYFLCRGDAFLESYIDGLARSQGTVVSGAEDEDQDENLIQSEEKQFLQDNEEFPDGRDFKFNNLSHVSFVIHNFIKEYLYGYLKHECSL